MQVFKENAARSAEVLREIQELDARLVRLRARLRDGDPVMAPDELQAAIDRTEIKRRQLPAGFHDGEDVAQMLSTALGGSAHGGTLGERIALGLQGDQQAGEEVILRTLIPDRIRLSKKTDGSLSLCPFNRWPCWPPVRVVGVTRFLVYLRSHSMPGSNRSGDSATARYGRAPDCS
jgi:hypothetical protein|nr:hypothetical protein [uncultured Steroidobacter sp.]